MEGSRNKGYKSNLTESIPLTKKNQSLIYWPKVSLQSCRYNFLNKYQWIGYSSMGKINVIITPKRELVPPPLRKVCYVQIRVAYDLTSTENQDKRLRMQKREAQKRQQLSRLSRTEYSNSTQNSPLTRPPIFQSKSQKSTQTMIL